MVNFPLIVKFQIISMLFALTQESSLGLNRFTKIVEVISNNLAEYFFNKSYDNLDGIIINLITVSPGFEFFFKQRKPKYKKGFEIINQHCTRFEIHSTLRYDIKLNFNKITNMKDIELISYIKGSIIDSLYIIESLKIEAFDTNIIKNDLTVFFENNSYKFL